MYCCITCIYMLISLVSSLFYVLKLSFWRIFYMQHVKMHRTDTNIRFGYTKTGMVLFQFGLDGVGVHIPITHYTYLQLKYRRSITFNLWILIYFKPISAFKAHSLITKLEATDIAKWKKLFDNTSDILTNHSEVKKSPSKKVSSKKKMSGESENNLTKNPNEFFEEIKQKFETASNFFLLIQ